MKAAVCKGATALVTMTVALLLAGAGCQQPPQPSPGAAQPAPSVPAIPAPPTNAEVAPVQCMLHADRDVTLRMRPDDAADIFGTLSAGETVMVGGRTAAGWLGFDPGVAQAPNVGPFRLRWIKAGEPYTLSGPCDAVPRSPSVPPRLCFVMTQTDTPIHASPTGKSPVTASMHFGDYVAAIGRKGTGADSWIKIDASVGSLDTTLRGWVDLGTIDFNGPCDALPAADR